MSKIYSYECIGLTITEIRYEWEILRDIGYREGFRIELDHISRPIFSSHPVIYYRYVEDGKNDEE